MIWKLSTAIQLFFLLLEFSTLAATHAKPKINDVPTRIQVDEIYQNTLEKKVKIPKARFNKDYNELFKNIHTGLTRKSDLVASGNPRENRDRRPLDAKKYKNELNQIAQGIGKGKDQGLLKLTEEILQKSRKVSNAGRGKEDCPSNPISARDLEYAITESFFKTVQRYPSKTWANLETCDPTLTAEFLIRHHRLLLEQGGEMESALYEKNQKLSSSQGKEIIPCDIHIVDGHIYIIPVRNTLSQGTYKQVRIALDLPTPLKLSPAVNPSAPKLVAETRLSYHSNSRDPETRLTREEQSKNVFSQEFALIEELKGPGIIDEPYFLQDFPIEKRFIAYQKLYEGDLVDLKKKIRTYFKDKKKDLSNFMYPNTFQIIHHMLSAVAKLHQEGVVHRDIKPENFLFTQKESPSGEPSWEVLPVLNDFGFSSKISEARSVAGTPVYLSPEFIRYFKRSLLHHGNLHSDLNPIDPSKLNLPGADAWALGLTLFDLLIPNHHFNTRLTRAPGTRIPRNRDDYRPLLDKIMNIKSREDLGLYFGIECKGNLLNDIICGLMDPKPEKRMTVLDALKKVENYCTQYPADYGCEQVIQTVKERNERSISHTNKD